MNSRRISTTETAKLIRKHLKNTFPNIKFYVTSSKYSGGASISIDWVDGPTTDDVDAVAQLFSGANFDGMIDLKVYNRHWLMPDGTVQLATYQGTEGSRGSIPTREYIQPHPKAELVSFGSDFIFTNRKTSPALVREAAEVFHAQTGWDIPEIKVSSGCYLGSSMKKDIDTAYYVYTPKTINGGAHFQTLDREYNAFLAKYSNYEIPATTKQETQAVFEEAIDEAVEQVEEAAKNPAAHKVTHEGTWTWVKFDKKHVGDIRQALKSKGFRFSGKRLAWYARQTIETSKVDAIIASA